MEVAQLVWIEAPRRQPLPFAIECNRSGPTDQPHGPFESSIRQRDRILAQQLVLHEHPETFLLGGAPLPAKPGRRRKADIEQRDDEKGGKLDQDLLDRIGGEGAGADGKQKDGNQSAEAETQRPQAPCLNRGQVSSDKPEADDRLDDRCAPDEDEHNHGNCLQGYRRNPGRDQALHGDEAGSSDHNRNDRGGVPSRRQRDQ